MAVPDDRLQQLIEGKDASDALHFCNKYGYNESWTIMDGALVIYDLDNPPAWLGPILALRDDDGNTIVTDVTPLRAPREGEYAPEAGDPVAVPFDPEEVAA